jgi:two-component system, NtrC family, response regulator HydG
MRASIGPRSRKARRDAGSRCLTVLSKIHDPGAWASIVRTGAFRPPVRPRVHARKNSPMLDTQMFRMIPSSDGGLREPSRPSSRLAPVCRALLVAEDPSVVRAVGEVAASIDRIALDVVDDEAGARDRLATGAVSLLMVHLAGYPDDPGLVQLVREARRAPRGVEAIVIGDEPAAERTADLLSLGVADCLTRPLDLKRLAYLLEILALREPQASASGPGDSSRDGGLGEQIGRIARSNATLLISGETGTGKTRLARRIHELSPRRDRPFLVVNCGARPAERLEAEIFGQVVAARPGAVANRVGKFAAVGDGTLFLDEIDALPIGLQVRFLRAVEDLVFEPVGPGTSRPKKARLIAASNRPLELEVAERRFRADLFYRLNVLSMTLPPLRGQVAAIPRLAREFLQEFSGRDGGRPRAFSPEAIRALESYRWPGNIRELREVVDRAIAQSKDEIISLGDLPENVRMRIEHPTSPAAQGRHPESLARSRQESERRRIEQALANQGNNRVRTAAELGISRVTLYRKLRKYGLQGADGEE